MSGALALHLLAQLGPGASRHEHMIGLAVLDWNVRFSVWDAEVLLVTGAVSGINISKGSSEADWGQEGLRLLVEGLLLEVAHHGRQLVWATDRLTAGNNSLRFDKRVVVRTIVRGRH